MVKRHSYEKIKKAMIGCKKIIFFLVIFISAIQQNFIQAFNPIVAQQFHEKVETVTENAYEKLKPGIFNKFLKDKIFYTYLKDKLIAKFLGDEKVQKFLEEKFDKSKTYEELSKLKLRKCFTEILENYFGDLLEQSEELKQFLKIEHIQKYLSREHIQRHFNEEIFIKIAAPDWQNLLKKKMIQKYLKNESIQKFLKEETEKFVQEKSMKNEKTVITEEHLDKCFTREGVDKFLTEDVEKFSAERTIQKLLPNKDFKEVYEIFTTVFIEEVQKSMKNEEFTKYYENFTRVLAEEFSVYFNSVFKTMQEEYTKD